MSAVFLISAVGVACSQGTKVRAKVGSPAANPCYVGPVKPQPIPSLASRIRPPVVDAAQYATQTPIKHVVFIMKENRTFDNLFGAFPGADGASTGKQGDKTVSLTSHCFPQALPRDIKHDYPKALADWNNGQMNGFGWDSYSAEWAYIQATQKDIPNYWRWAQDYSLGDRFFASVLGPSFPNHLYSFAGTAAGTHDNPVPAAGRVVIKLTIPQVYQKSWGCDAPKGTFVLVDHSGDSYPPPTSPGDTHKFPCFNMQTVADSLKSAGIPWAYYGADDTQLGYFWDAPDYIDHIRNNPILWESRVRGVNSIVPDIQDGRLPPVTWVTPAFWLSDHPDANLCDGENWTTTVVDAIMNSPMWKNTAIFIVWDDWGGFYDHVVPPDGMGFRTPMLAISPYSKPGHIDNTVSDFGSILRFIEYNWKLPDMVDQGSSTDMTSNFDFTQTPVPPDPLPLRTDCQQFTDQRAYVDGH